jgi:hypothetical protein
MMESGGSGGPIWENHFKEKSLKIFSRTTEPEIFNI